MPTGCGGEECSKSDGRELWILAEMYHLRGMMDWLLEEGIHAGTICAAWEFGLVPEGVERGILMEACWCYVANNGLGEVEEGGLRGAGLPVVRELLQARLFREMGKEVGWRGVREGCPFGLEDDNSETGKELGWLGLKEGVLFVIKWLMANGGMDGEHFAEGVDVIQHLDLGRMPLRARQGVLQRLVPGLEPGHCILEMCNAEVGDARPFEAEFVVNRVFGDRDGPTGRTIPTAWCTLPWIIEHTRPGACLLTARSVCSWRGGGAVS